jgi:hypothetical protein
MITLGYHPFTDAVIDAWRRSLPQGGSSRTTHPTEEDLRDLIRQLCLAIEVLTESMDTALLIQRIQSATSSVGEQEHHQMPPF